MDVVGNMALSATEIRRAMRNYCGSQDVDRALNDLVRDRELILEDNLYRNYKLGLSRTTFTTPRIQRKPGTP
jgi:hypothetical protein